MVYLVTLVSSLACTVLVLALVREMRLRRALARLVSRLWQEVRTFHEKS